MVSRLLSKHCESDVEDNFEAKRTFHHQWYKCIYWCCHNLQVLGVIKFFKLCIRVTFVYMECGGLWIMKLQECLKSFGWCGVGAEEVYGAYPV